MYGERLQGDPENIWTTYASHPLHMVLRQNECEIFGWRGKALDCAYWISKRQGVPRDNGSLKEARSLLSKYVKPKNEDPFWAMIAVKIYVSSRGKKWGPYSLKQVDFLLAKGSFQLSDWAWAEHIAKWVSVSEMLGLLDRCDEQKECCPLAKQPDGVRLETKPCSSQIEKQPAQFNAGCILKK